MIYSDKVKFDHTEYIDPCLCNSWVAAAIGGSAIVGAGASIWGSSKASDAQQQAAAQAAAVQKEMYEKTRADLTPYRDIGGQATGDLSRRLSDLTAPISIDPNVLENSDYYKFAMTQGQKAVTNAAAARGLAKSGAALKGAAAFAKGLATDTYKTAWDMENQNKSNAYNRLKGLVDTGANAAAMTGNAGTASATGQSNALIGEGNAAAAGYNAAGGAIKGAADNLGGYAMYKGLYGGGGGSAGPITLGGPNGPTPFA